METGSEPDCRIDLAERRSPEIAESAPGPITLECQAGAVRVPTVVLVVAALVVAAFAEGIQVALRSAYRERVSDPGTVAGEAAEEHSTRSVVVSVQAANLETAAGLSSLADRAASVALEEAASEEVADSDIPVAGIRSARLDRHNHRTR